MRHDYLLDYLTHAPASLALLRAIECRELAHLEFQRPLLDLGCGDGLFGKLFFKDKPEVGLDFSAGELHTAAARGAYAQLVRADIARVPFEDNSFASVFSNGVLEHVHDLAAGLAEIRRVLRPGGRLIFTVPTMEDELQLAGTTLLRRVGLPKAALLYADTYNRAFGQINLFTWQGWRDRLAESGLSLVRHRAYAGQAVFRLHDLTMPLSLPNYLCKRLTGRWSVLPGVRRRTVAPLWAKLLRSIYLDDGALGCSLLLVAEPVSIRGS